MLGKEALGFFNALARIIWVGDNGECDDDDDDDKVDNDDNGAGADYMSWQARGATKVSIFGTICSPLSFLLVCTPLALLYFILYNVLYMLFTLYTLYCALYCARYALRSPFS